MIRDTETIQTEIKKSQEDKLSNTFVTSGGEIVDKSRKRNKKSKKSFISPEEAHSQLSELDEE